MRCIVAWERGGDQFYPRSTEERMALEYEMLAASRDAEDDSFEAAMRQRVRDRT